MFKKIKNKKGFTLTELIVVIVIIGILAAVLIPSLTGYITKAKKSADEQKVASLNTLLIEVQVNETDFSDAIELKEYLEDEMDYDGDYSLKVEGSYMWYDSVKRKVVIITEDDEKMNLSTTATVTLRPLASEETFKLVTNGENLKSPEGLMQYSSGEEVWLIGGNGYLFDLVEEIRNIGNSGEGTLTEYGKLSDGTVKNVFEKFFENTVFSGTKGNYQVEKNGNVSAVTSDYSQKNVVNAKSNLAKLFHEEVILKNLDYFKEDLNGLCEIDIKEYNENVKITITAESGYLAAASSVIKIMRKIYENGCEIGYVIPKEFKTVENYEAHLKNIYNLLTNSENTDSKYTISSELSNSISEKYTDFSKEDLEKLYKVNIKDILDELDGNSSSTESKFDLWQIYGLLDVALNLKFDGSEYKGKLSINDTTYKFFENKNLIKLIGSINSEKYGTFDIEYTFEFKIAESVTKEKSEQ